VPVSVATPNEQMRSLKINQRDGRNEGAVSLGKATLPTGRPVTVAISNKGTDGHVVCDGVQFSRVK
jgi:hypothetical protein